MLKVENLAINLQEPSDNRVVWIVSPLSKFCLLGCSRAALYLSNLVLETDIILTDQEPAGVD